MEKHSISVLGADKKQYEIADFRARGMDYTNAIGIIVTTDFMSRILAFDTWQERWGDYYNEGDLTNCFNTIEEIIALAKEVFRLRFIGDWEFYVESPYSRYDGKLDINNQPTGYE